MTSWRTRKRGRDAVNLSSRQRIEMHSLNSHATGPGDLEPASANVTFMLVVEVGIEGVEVSVVIEASALKVSVVREVTAEVVTAVTVIATEETVVMAATLPTNTGLTSVPARDAGGGVGDVKANIRRDVAEVMEDVEPQLRKELELFGREDVVALVRVEGVPRGRVILEHIAPKPVAEAVEVELEVLVVVDREL